MLTNVRDILLECFVRGNVKPFFSTISAIDPTFVKSFLTELTVLIMCCWCCVFINQALNEIKGDMKA